MKHVLVVDDEVLAAMALRSFLQRKGYKVTLAHDAEDGFDRFITDSADVVVADWRMPGATGGQMVEKLRALRPALPVLFVTGYAPEVLPFVERATAPTALLDKPVDPGVVIERLKTLLGG